MKRIGGNRQGILDCGVVVVALTIGSSSALAGLGYPCESPLVPLVQAFDSSFFRVFTLTLAAGALICFGFLPAAIRKRAFVVIFPPSAIAAAASYSVVLFGIPCEIAFLAWLFASMAIGEFLLRETQGANVSKNQAPPSGDLSLRGHVDGETRQD